MTFLKNIMRYYEKFFSPEDTIVL